MNMRETNDENVRMLKDGTSFNILKNKVWIAK